MTAAGRQSPLSELGAHVRVQDPDRFYAALFAPAAARETLFALLAFNHEVARVRETVSQPLGGEIRLQWWAEVLEEIPSGRVRAHPVAQGLAAGYRAQPFALEKLAALVEARGFDLEQQPMASLEALEAYAKATGGGLHQAMAQALGADAQGLLAADHAGTAWALTGLLRALPSHLSAGRIYLPADRLDLHRVALGSLRSGKSSPGLAAVIAEVATLARRHYERALRLKAGAARPAVLPMALVPLYLKRVMRAAHSSFRTRMDIARPEKLLRLLAASLRG
jgi:phytoene synthase